VCNSVDVQRQCWTRVSGMTSECKGPVRRSHDACLPGSVSSAAYRLRIGSNRNSLSAKSSKLPAVPTSPHLTSTPTRHHSVTPTLLHAPPPLTSPRSRAICRAPIADSWTPSARTARSSLRAGSALCAGKVPRKLRPRNRQSLDASRLLHLELGREYSLRLVSS
jgi:hypothetical protein